MNIYEELRDMNFFSNYKDQFDKYEKDVTQIFDRYDHNTLFKLYMNTMENLLGSAECYMTPSDEAGCISNALGKYLRENISDKKVNIMSELSHYI